MTEVRIATDSMSADERLSYQYMCNFDYLSNWY